MANESASLGGTQFAQRKMDSILEALNPNGVKKDKEHPRPYYATGARCLIKVGGAVLLYCRDFQWQVSYQVTPIQTIDTVTPWDLDVGQVTINATMNKIMDPMKGPEVNAIFPIMAAAVHQPMVEIQVLYTANYVSNNEHREATAEDRTDFSMFFARGMFTSIDSGVGMGKISEVTAKFVGVAYQHYVSQAFRPYSSAYLLKEAAKFAQGAVTAVSGGFL